MATAESLSPSVRSASTNLCRLTIQINGVRYSVQPERGNTTFGSMKAFRLRKSGNGTVYVVSQTLSGLVCTCPSFAHWQGPPTCKHVRALVAAGLLDPPDASASRRRRTAWNLPLADQAEREAEAYRSMGTPEGDLFAQTMDELASRIRFTNATTPDEYEARIGVLEDDVQERWEAIGYEQGRRSGCHCDEHVS